jgi:hypothetical protein
MKILGPFKTRRKRAGAASLEAVILLPVFILIFAGILYVETLWETQQQALLQARKCAWLYANTGCDEEQLTQDCVDALHDTEGLTEGNSLAESMNGGVLDGLTEVPLVGPVIEGLFASAFDSRSSRKIQRTPILGEKTVAVIGGYYLICNEKERDMLDVIKDAFCSTVGDVSGCP